MQPLETVLAAALPPLQQLTCIALDRCLQGRDPMLLDFAPISAALNSSLQQQSLRIGQNVCHLRALAS